MEKNLYVAETGSWCLTASEKPGVVTEELIKDNIERMMWMDEENEDLTWRQLRRKVDWEYEENPDRFLEMAHLNEELVPMDKETVESELETMPWSEFIQMELPFVEND